MLDNLFSSLPIVPFGRLYIIENLDTPRCNTTIATSKGWAIGDYTPVKMLWVTKKDSVKIILRGTGSVAIDWSDNATNVYSFPPIPTVPIGFQLPDYALPMVECTHNYWSSVMRIIVIYGANVTYMNCRNNQLTELDTRANSQLEQLYCDSSQLALLAVGWANESKLKNFELSF